jgi:hypothetical protein
MSLTLSGRLDSTRSDRVALAECRIEVYFEQKAPAKAIEPPIRPANGEDDPAAVKAGRQSARKVNGEKGNGASAPAPAATLHGYASARAEKSGRFQITVPDGDDLSSKKLRFVVSAPSGQTIADVEHDVDRMKSPVLIPVSAKDLEPIELKPLRDQPRAEKRRITGKVMERSGNPLPPNLQVLVFGRKRPEKGAKTDGTGTPILMARADATGYFSGVVEPDDSYDSAAATVSGLKEEINVALGRGGYVPTSVPLVVDFPVTKDLPAKTDCECDISTPRTPSHDDIDSAPDVYSTDLGTGRCVKFNTPNRSIEEFDFYTVVRTTEPGIRMRTLPDVTRGNYAEGEARAASAVAAAEAVALALATVAAESETKAVKAEAAAKAAALTAKLLGSSLMLAMNPVLGKGLADQAKEQADQAEADGDAARADATASAAAAKSAAGVVVTARAAVEKMALAAAAATAKALAEAAARASSAADRPRGRHDLAEDNPVDWDLTPTFYEAATIAHGHLLHFKQVWYADGYSLGDLLYSLPLAPGQKKLISVVDWERKERTERTEATFGSEELKAALSRDRDLGEVVTGALTESARGGSKSTSAGVGAGTGAAGNGSYGGFNFGALLGVSGGYGEANAAAWQDSARSLSSSSIQTLRDRTLQSASAVRGMRSSVVHTVTQGEAVTATTEVVANHNHCHALTIQYFEVLRHLKLVHELADVQDCLFVPMPMTEFDLSKVLRWRQPLQTYLQRRELSGGFDAARRVETAWTEVDVPLDRYADEVVTSIAGELMITVIIPLPPFLDRPKPTSDPAETAKAMSEAVNPTSGFLGVLLAIGTGGASLATGLATRAAIDVTSAGARALTDQLAAEPTPQERYEKFHRDVVPGVVEGFMDQLELYALVGAHQVQLKGTDFTLASEYQPGVPMLVSLRATLPGQIRRGEISQLIIKSAHGLPSGCRAIVKSATIRYRTKTFEHAFVDDERVNDDIDLPKIALAWISPIEFDVKVTMPGSGAALYTPIDAWEQRSPRTEDRRLTAELIEHINDNLEFYHHAIWWTMDPNRRYMLLDGYYAPNSGGRSVASVVENRLIGIVGNSFVLPVARGVHLNPRFISRDPNAKHPDLLEFYALKSPLAPTRVSIPTRGVFAEAVMGQCNACEQMDESRFWRWEQSPIDEPTALESPSTMTRRGEPANVLPSPFPSPMVAIQNLPAVPDPTGVGPTLDTLTKQSFADFAGLAGTQANAAAAYQQALETAFKFGKEASTLAQQAAMLNAKDKALGAIDNAENEGKIDAADAKNLRMSALKKMVGDGSTTGTSTAAAAEQMKFVRDVVKDGGITKEDGRGYTKTVLDAYTGGTDADQRDRAATADLKERMSPDRVTKVQTTPDGTLVEQASFPVIDPARAGSEPDAYRWGDLILFTPSATLLNGIGTRGMQLQTLDDGYSDVNLDYYALEITRLPKDPATGARFSAREFFEYVRLGFPALLAQFPAMPGGPFSFGPYEATDATTWASTTPLGAIMKFSIDAADIGVVPMPEWGLVLASEYSTDDVAGDWHWNFVTVKGGGVVRYHPVSGTRQFGLRRVGSSYLFYVRAADRVSTFVEALAEYYFKAVFAGGDRYWKTFFSNLHTRINANDGLTGHKLSDSRRHPWSEVKVYRNPTDQA